MMPAGLYSLLARIVAVLLASLLCACPFLPSNKTEKTLGTGDASETKSQDDDDSGRADDDDAQPGGDDDDDNVNTTGDDDDGSNPGNVNSEVDCKYDDSGTDSYAANKPIGCPKGINGGRVVWIRDADATEQNGAGFWWENQNTNQTVVNTMFSNAIQWLTGKTSDNDAWDALFKHFNSVHHGSNTGYAAGEKIAIKLNLVNSSSTGAHGGKIDASPQAVMALAKQLVEKAGVGAANITFYDSSRTIPGMIYDYVHAQYAGIRFMDIRGTDGRIKAQTDETSPLYSSDGTINAKLPQTLVQAKYFINMANLKSHGLTGVTLCAKNLFGTVYGGGSFNIGSPLHNPIKTGMNQFNALVDLMGHKHTGGKGLLYIIDGLYGGFGAGAVPTKWSKFGNDWPSSIFMSQDPVAIDSVGLDFIRSERSINAGSDGYLHEAAMGGDRTPSGTKYDPEKDGSTLRSLGTHEHWNSWDNKQYSRNLGTGKGIELISSKP